MGTKVQNLPGYYSMRDLNEESSSCGWPLFYGDKTLTNGQYYSDYQPSASVDGCSVYDKEVVKRMMLEHEATFKKQVYELHRLYRIQKNLMDEAKRKELHRNQMPAETSFLTGHLASQITLEDGLKWCVPGFPMANSACARPSISGVEGVHSPLGKQAGLFPFPNGSSSKDVEVLESQSSKARRKMFDLHLPADQYIDTEESEKVSDENMNGTAVFLPDRHCNHGKENGVKLFCGNGGKAGSQEDSSRSYPSLRRANGLADLNEPIQVEETNSSVYGHLSPYSCQGANECSGLSAKENSRFFNLSGDVSFNSHHGSDEHLENNGSRRGWISSVLESGQARSNPKHIPQALKQEKSILSSRIMHDVLSKTPKPPTDYLTNLSKTDLWREKTACDLEVRERSHEMSINKHPESVVSSHRSSLSAIVPSSNLSNSWPHSASSWEIASSSLSQKLMSVQTSPCVNAPGTVSTNSLSGQSNGILGGSWPVNTNSNSNRGFRCEAPVQNGFYNGSSSGSRELSVNISSLSYDYLNHNHDRKRKSEDFMNHDFAKYYKSSNCNDMKSGKDVNLNGPLSNGSSNKHEEHLAVLPWLRPKTAFKNEPHNAGRGSTSGESSISQAGKGPSGNFVHSVTSVSCSNDIEPRRTEECSSFMSPSVSIPSPSDIETAENKKKRQVFDINLPCDAAVLELDKEDVAETIASRKGSPKVEANPRNQIDLNLSMSDDDEETSLTPIPTNLVKMKPEIDLEAPAVPETEEDVDFEEKQQETNPVSPKGSQDRAEQSSSQDELTKCAAEAIVAMSTALLCNEVADVISNPSETPTMDPLNWRGRQQRDFQRDILPGIASLSRHEVTEDLQTFGGLMRATGHPWHSGLTRRSSSRNGGGRGRRRLQQRSNIEVGLEDRSLTGWGKTTRRPRRQRFPAGNPVPIALT
ncbi:uncharacterized protein G2W53_035812 [Senna tora]|uniref:Uncharacterized protein n=1 Tax=Senna tora TaxID=362788 RepID=A0A834T426_9FABA|nr:uncharacterized protein G2W53_035812 [Senna tora]